MNILDFIKDLWAMVKDNKWILLSLTILMTLIFSVLYFLFQNIASEEIATDEELESEIKIGTIDIYADADYENISLYPALPSELIDEIHEWDRFAGDFSLGVNNDSTLNFIDNFNSMDELDESFNPLESLLGLTNANRDLLLYDKESGNYFLTVEVEPASGNVSVVDSHFGISDYLIDLNINNDPDIENTLEDLENDNDSFLDVSFGMDPGGSRFARIETQYDWKYEMSSQRTISNNRNFYISDPEIFKMNPLTSETNDISLRGIVRQVGLFFILSLILSAIAIFVWNILNKTINYSFTYGWNSHDLHLKYNNQDSSDQIIYDMLQSNYSSVAIISQASFVEGISEAIEQLEEKEIMLSDEINHLPLNNSYEEFVLVIKRNVTSKDWYLRQRKHLKAYRNKSIKIIEL